MPVNNPVTLLCLELSLEPLIVEIILSVVEQKISLLSCDVHLSPLRVLVCPVLVIFMFRREESLESLSSSTFNSIELHQ